MHESGAQGTRLWLFAGTVLALMGAEFVVAWHGATPGKATTWLLSHDLGYTARALLPQLSRMVWGIEKYGHLRSITINGLLILVLIGLGYLALSLQAARGRNDLLPALIVLFALAPPGGFSWFASDFDRPAAFDYALLLGALMLLARRGSRWRYVAVCGLACALSILIYEPALVITIPVLLACLALTAADDRDANPAAGPPALKILLCAGMLLIALALVGLQKPLDEAATSAILDLCRVRADFEPVADAITAPAMTLAQHSAENSAWLRAGAGGISLLSALATLLPCLVAAVVLLTFLGAWSRFSNDSLTLRLGALSCLSPLLLCFVAPDYGRWCAYAATNLSLFVLFAFLVDCDVPPDLARPGRDRWSLLIIALLIQCLLGTNGVRGGPPRLVHKIQAGLESLNPKLPVAPPAPADHGPSSG